MFKSFKYRLRPTKKQEKILLAHIDACRILYNQLLCARIQAWQKDEESLSRYDQQDTLPMLKNQYEPFSVVHSQVLQQVCQRVDLAFKGFFRRLRERTKTGEKAGFPRYKSENRYDSITYTQFSSSCRLDGKGLRLSKIGCIRVVEHRPLEGVPKCCTITRTATGKWYASIPCDIGDTSEETDDGSAVGVDVGLDSFAVTSDGEKIENRRFFREEEKALARAQQKWDAVKKRPKTDAVRERRRKVIGRVHERIRNKRHNFAHQESRKMVNRHGFIAVEKLDVKEMQKNRRLAKSIADVAWSLFRHCLEYKAEEAGIGFKAVKPDYTSQDCSACGHREKKTLSDRVHHCKVCGYKTDRDHNAAINILTLGLQRQAVNRQEAHRL
ncbi:MAG: transposase [Gemmatimonadota bacterium]|nr:transposase [Gemmatimonadota bacterium]